MACAITRGTRLASLLLPAPTCFRSASQPPPIVSTDGSNDGVDQVIGGEVHSDTPNNVVRIDPGIAHVSSPPRLQDSTTLSNPPKQLSDDGSLVCDGGEMALVAPDVQLALANLRDDPLGR
jgi:hypothetical protein